MDVVSGSRYAVRLRWRVRSTSSFCRKLFFFCMFLQMDPSLICNVILLRFTGWHLRRLQEAAAEAVRRQRLKWRKGSSPLAYGEHTRPHGKQSHMTTYAIYFALCSFFFFLIHKNSVMVINWLPNRNKYIGVGASLAAHNFMKKRVASHAKWKCGKLSVWLITANLSLVVTGAVNV